VDSVRIIGRPKALINNLPGVYCDPAKVGFSNGSSSELPLKYYWQFSNGKTSTLFEPTQVFSPQGVYGATLIVETSGVCNDTSIYTMNNITVNTMPKANFTISPKETSIFDPEITVTGYWGVAGLDCYYSFGDGTGINSVNATHSYEEPGDYKISLLVSNGFGCRDSSSDTVRILPEFRFWIPNSFSPDDNSLNDIFMPVVMGVSNYEFDIFDRWGQRIFRTHNPKEGWNGYFKNKECPQGIYIWKISYKNSVEGKTGERVGHVNLFRNP
jgi:gliding motility-associated-like protein